MEMDDNTKEVLILLLQTVSTAFLAYLAWQVPKARNKLNAVANDVLRVEKATNSHATQLNEAIAAASHAKGVEQERDRQAEHDADDTPDQIEGT
jgi:hypothetical protein